MRIFKATHDKYKDLKSLIIPYEYPSLNKIRIGPNEDSGYVVDYGLFIRSAQVLSLGIGSGETGCMFDLECAKVGKRVYMFDESIEEPGLKHDNFRFFKQNVYKDNFISILEENIRDNSGLLKCDIEGWEYDIINSESIRYVENRFSQLVFEVHDLIEEVPQGWELSAKNHSNRVNIDLKKNFFSLLNKYYTLCHIHGNNHGAVYGDFPGILELLYIRKRDILDYVVVQKEFCPQAGLDYPCWPQSPDYKFKWW